MPPDPTPQHDSAGESEPPQAPTRSEAARSEAARSEARRSEARRSEAARSQPANRSPQARPTTDARTLIAVCTYNEAANIETMLRRLRGAVPSADVLVVDDESPDGTARLVETVAGDDPQVRLIVRRGERGLGGAIRRAIEEAIERDYTFFVNLDGDTSHAPEEVPRLMAAASGTAAKDASRDRSPSANPDVVIGSRYVPGGQVVGWPLRRRMMSRILNRFATGCLRLPVRDCSGSMRCYRVDALRRVDRTTLRSNGYALLEELLVRLHRQHATMVEVPITFTDRAAGESKLTFREAMRSVWQILRLSWS